MLQSFPMALRPLFFLIIIIAAIPSLPFPPAVVESQPTNPINQTDLQIATADMRAMSYHGFVILLKILDSTSNPLPDQELTFLMPTNEELSRLNQTAEHLQDFILSHSIPSALLLSHLLHFPNGTLVPSGSPNKMLRITNWGRSGLFVNNARIAIPNVCLNSVIRCHGISAAITFDDDKNGDSSSTVIRLDLSLDVRALPGAGSSSSLHLETVPAPH